MIGLDKHHIKVRASFQFAQIRHSAGRVRPFIDQITEADQCICGLQSELIDKGAQHIALAMHITNYTDTPRHFLIISSQMARQSAVYLSLQFRP